MNSSDIHNASVSLNGAVKFFSPMVTALNQAQEVFDVLQNAAKHKDVLVRDVEALKKDAEDLKAQAEASRAAITSNNASAIEAKNLAAKQIADAQADAAVQIKEIKASVSAKTKSVVEALAAKEAEFAEKTSALQNDFDSNMESKRTAKDDLEKSILALEAKLDGLRAQAKKFAASLTAE
jgi:ATP-dependent DNA ligase